MGIPAFEQAGVPNQRIAYSHPFHPEDIQWVIGNADPTIQILEALPDDWRYPDPEE